MKKIDEAIENYFIPKPAAKLNLSMLKEMVESELSRVQGRLLQERSTARERAVRFPLLVPTEKSVGQTPDSEDRKQFELWMGKIGGEGSVSDKIKALTNYFDNAATSIEESTIAETLSYLMFLNSFDWMLKEFNPAVAGFLWEPFLAALFGGKSRQVPTSEGDIADIRIEFGGTEAPISLKILNEEGDVKGSFTDLVKHFAEGGTEMRYVIVVKEQFGKEKTVNAATFYEFNIQAENFFEWIGRPQFEEKMVLVKGKELNVAKAGKKDHTHLRFGDKDAPGGEKGNYLWVRHAIESRGKVKKDWVKLAMARKAGWLVFPTSAKRINLSPMPDLDERGNRYLDAKATYTADIADIDVGGKGGYTVKRDYGKIPGTGTAETTRLWGGAKELEYWAQALAKAESSAEFFKKVQEEAPGAINSEQFHISPTHYKGLGEKLGSLSTRGGKILNIFELGAEKLGADLTIMFNSMAELADNIGRFFLSDCGGQEGPQDCSDKDMKDRGSAGAAAMINATDLEKAVIKSVSKMK